MLYSSNSWDCDTTATDNYYCDGTVSTDNDGTDTNTQNTDTTDTTDSKTTDNTNDNTDTTDSSTTITIGSGDSNDWNGTDSNDANTNDLEAKSNGNEDFSLLIMIGIIAGVSLFIILICVICIRYIFRHEDRFFWFFDWIVACCKNETQKEIPAVYPNTTTFSSHMKVVSIPSGRNVHDLEKEPISPRDEIAQAKEGVISKTGSMDMNKSAVVVFRNDNSNSK